MTIAPENNFLLNLSPSCTRDRAVLHLFGIGDGAIYERTVKLNSAGEVIGDEDFKIRFEATLEEYLIEKYREVLRQYSDAVPQDATDEEVSTLLQAKIGAIEHVESMIEAARSLLIDIVDELAKGSDSQLRIDLETTNRTGVEHITLKSLKEWFNIFEKQKEKFTGEQSRQPLESPQALLVSKDNVVDSDRFRNIKSPKEMSKSERSLYVSLAICGESHAKDLGESYWSGDGGMNVAKLAEAISEFGLTSVAGGDKFPDQSVSSIRARLTLAKECKKYVLKG